MTLQLSLIHGGSNKVNGEDMVEKRKTSGDLMWSLKRFSPVTYRFAVPRTPKLIKDHVLKSQTVRNAIAELCRETGRSIRDVEAEAINILEEMGHNYQLRTVRGFGFVLSKLMRQLFTAIYVNIDGIEKVRAVVPDFPILLMPTHRSYVDFLLLSYVCFMYDLPLPVIAAGVDFMAMKIVSTLMRNAGAFFIRRAFGNNILYWSIFTEYVQTHVRNGDAPIEFFVEGTRSRTAKSLTPKLGLLMAAVEPYFKSQVMDTVIVPISISYDRTLEESLYSYELIGVPKPKETTRGLLKARRILDECFGTIHVHFSEPIHISKFCAEQTGKHRHHCVGPRHLSPLSSDEQSICKALAYRVLREHQRHIVLAPFTLIATVLLVHGKQTMPLAQLGKETLWLRDIVTALGSKVDCDERKSIEFEIKRAAHTHHSAIQICQGANSEQFIKIVPAASNNVTSVVKEKSDLKGHVLHPETLSNAVPCILLSHYSNQLLHVLIRSALVAIALRSPSSNGHHYTDSLLTKYELLESLFNHDFIFEAGRTHADFAEALNSLERLGTIHQHDRLIQPIPSGSNTLKFLCQLFDPFLIGYRIVWEVILGLGQKDALASVACIVREAQAFVERLLQQKLVTQFAMLSLDLLNNAVLSLIDLGVLQKEKRGIESVFHLNRTQLETIIKNMDQFVKMPGIRNNLHFSTKL